MTNKGELDMKHSMKPEKVCSSKVDFQLDGNIVRNVKFTGGCDGNLKAISALVEGKTVEEITGLLQGITCGFKNTSCSDQLCRLLNIAYQEEQQKQ